MMFDSPLNDGTALIRTRSRFAMSRRPGYQGGGEPRHHPIYPLISIASVLDASKSYYRNGPSVHPRWEDLSERGTGSVSHAYFGGEMGGQREKAESKLSRIQWSREKTFETHLYGENLILPPRKINLPLESPGIAERKRQVPAREGWCPRDRLCSIEVVPLSLHREGWDMRIFLIKVRRVD